MVAALVADVEPADGGHDPGRQPVPLSPAGNPGPAPVDRFLSGSGRRPGQEGERRRQAGAAQASSGLHRRAHSGTVHSHAREAEKALRLGAILLDDAPAGQAPTGAGYPHQPNPPPHAGQAGGAGSRTTRPQSSQTATSSSSISTPSTSEGAGADIGCPDCVTAYTISGTARAGDSPPE